MKRVLVIALALLIGVPLLLWAGFRVWLATQPDEFRATIEAFDTVEFLTIVYEAFAKPPEQDRATFGRREYAGRGHSPWVLRSSLDGRPRMLLVALAPELWLAYSTETAGIHQLWRGDVDFTGPVYDAQHGHEPTSRGDAYLHPGTATPWRVETAEGFVPAKVQWRGHGFDPASGALWLRFDVLDAEGAARRVTEWPERVANESGGTAATFERRFSLGDGPPIALALERSSGEIEIEIGAGAAWEEGLILFTSDATRIVQRFDRPRLPIERTPPPPAAEDAFARHDCHTCHNVRERMVGPAWSEVALRYAGTPREISASQLAGRIREGSVGRWGSVAMPPHPDVAASEALALARGILETEPSEPPVVSVDEDGDLATWTFRSETEDPPDGLHPALRSTPLDGPEFTPQVGGLAWLPDGRLAVATWDRDGAVFAVEGWQGPPDRIRVTRIAEGLHEPLGMTVDGDALYVMQKQEITRLIDHDGDDWIDEYRTVANDWRATSNFHEFGFGLVARDGLLYGSLSTCILNGGKSCRDQTPDRGKLFRADPETGEVEFVASGFRTPNGVALMPSGQILITDNQGDWLPASKLIALDPDAASGRAPDFGWRAPGDRRGPAGVTPPTCWLPHNEVGNSPTQPLVLRTGPYAGHVLFGDIFNGGLKRAVLENVEGQLQCAAFHFSGGLEAPVNRLLATPDGGFIVGQIGSRGNWGEYGKDRFGIEALRFEGGPAFEPMRMVATPGGFDLHFSRPLASDVELAPRHFTMSDWYYVPSEIYGGPKYDLRSLAVERLAVSADRRIVSLSVPGLEAGRVVYLHMDDAIRSQAGEALWVNEAWYTLNAIPSGARALETSPGVSASPPVSAPPPNTLGPEERAAGWRLLFDGESFAGWKLYGDEDDPTEFWEIENGALKFTRDVSLVGLAWNHINPFARAAADLMTKERFDDFELSIDWKISPGGNSGIFYLVPDEQRRLAWDLGLEMQVLDDAGHSDGAIDLHRAGDLYDLQSLTRNAARPVGEWNHARIRRRGDHLEHWLNGEKIVDLVRGSPEWDRAIANSKFANVEGFGLADRGHIVLQDHGDIVWYRNVEIRELDRARTPALNSSSGSCAVRKRSTSSFICAADFEVPRLKKPWPSPGYSISSTFADASPSRCAKIRDERSSGSFVPTVSRLGGADSKSRSIGVIASSGPTSGSKAARPA